MKLNKRFEYLNFFKIFEYKCKYQKNVLSGSKIK